MKPCFQHLAFITALLFSTLPCYGQTTYPTQDSIHIFWQPGLKITYADYQGPLTKEVDDLMNIYPFTASASVGIWSILDIPEKKKDRYKKFEKVYFAPAFERTTSYAKSNDTLQIQMQNIYLDFCEVAARWARQQLASMQDSTKATGTLTILYMTIEQEMDEKRLDLYRGYFNDVFVDRKEGAFAWWRKLIDDRLANTSEWATTPAECYRLMTGVPIEEGYIQAPSVIGPMFEGDKR